MTYDSFVTALLARFPSLRAELNVYMTDDEPLPYVAFGATLIPLLEKALDENDTSLIQEICNFIESVSDSGREDVRLDNLVYIELGEWLPSVPQKETLLSFLGAETKRVLQWQRSPRCKRILQDFFRWT